MNEFFKPGVDLLGKFLPLFYTPALVAVPTSAGLLAGADIAKLLTIVTVVVVASYTTTAKVTVFLQSLSKSNTEVRSPARRAPPDARLLQRAGVSVERAVAGAKGGVVRRRVLGAAPRDVGRHFGGHHCGGAPCAHGCRDAVCLYDVSDALVLHCGDQDRRAAA